MFAVLNVILLLVSRTYSVQVIVSEGILDGKINSYYGDSYYSFEGIPYAQPPVGDLRFKPPQPAKPWYGIRQAKAPGNVCFYYDTSPIGYEDCLYLNVFTPNITTKRPYAVMVWIHGGGFTRGSGNEYQPDFLIRKDVILVTLNYRLQILGFLSLQTKDISGNMGLKDQVSAIKWIKNNIQHFGGDPENVTIFGQSAGAVSVSYHLISPMTKGLFKRAITQSGTAHGWWPRSFRPRDTAVEMARRMGCNSTDVEEIYAFLKTQPLKAFNKCDIYMSFAQYAKESPKLVFGIVSEESFGDEVYFQGDVYDALKEGIHVGVDILNGYTADEGVLYFMADTNSSKVFQQANQFLEFFVPEPLAINVPLLEQMVIGNTMKHYYIKDAIVSKENIDKMLMYMNFDMTIYSTILWQKFMAKRNMNRNYLYKFICESERNVFGNINNAKSLFQRQIVSHSDDLMYLFPMNLECDRNSETFKIIDRVTTLWTNFAKFGDPTPNDDLGVTWSPYTLEKQVYLEIGNTLKLRAYPEREQEKFWNTLFMHYLPRVLP
ncbi:unnamed protein product [Pieris brassicae]|uniref:Carboxylic ester hydrolase n=1 Tax=Pieris brassicae TaxID=7116 RepID=A0A9P0XBM7_PIEBR|nr:unnamed protein product [Pieris brassicae]